MENIEKQFHEQPQIQNIYSKDTKNSQFLYEYLRYFGFTSHQQFCKAAQVKLSKLSNSIYFDSSQNFQQNIEIKIINYSQKCEFIQVKARLGNIICPYITIVNISGNSPTHNLMQSKLGTFASVSKCHLFGQQLAIKCRGYKQSSLGQILIEVIQEVFFLMLASQLRVGPNMNIITGYTIIVYESCIQFLMEYGEELGYEQFLSKKTIRELQQNLLQLHQLNIVHMDIKHANICWSPFFHRSVFIDFGLSKILRQTVGRKSKTAFRGTLAYCSQQMKYLSKNGDQKYIDLYYNDISCLSKIDREEYFEHDKYQPSEIGSNLIQLNNKNQLQQKMMVAHHLPFFFKFQIFTLNFSFLIKISQKYSGNQALFKIYNSLNSIANFPVVQFIKNTYFAKKAPLQYQDLNSEIQNIKRIKQAIIIKSKLPNIKIDSFNQSKEYQISILFLQQPLELNQQRYQYAIILSRALSLNSIKYTHEQRLKFCNISIQRLGISGQIYKDSILAIVTKYLFEMGLKGHHHQRLQIIRNCTPNIVILQIYDCQKMLQYLSSLLEQQLTDYYLLAYLAQFSKGIWWLFYTAISYEIFEELERGTCKILLNWMQNNNKCKILQSVRFIMGFESNLNYIQGLKDILVQKNQQKLINEIVILVIHRKLIKYLTGCGDGLTLKTYQDLLQNLLILTFQDNFKIYLSIQYYHFTFIMLFHQFILKKQFDNLVIKFNDVFRESPFLHFNSYQILMSLQDGSAINSSQFMAVLQKMRGKKLHSYFDKLIINGITNFCLLKRDQFCKLSLQSKALLIENLLERVKNILPSNLIIKEQNEILADFCNYLRYYLLLLEIRSQYALIYSYVLKGQKTTFENKLVKSYQIFSQIIQRSFRINNQFLLGKNLVLCCILIQHGKMNIATDLACKIFKCLKNSYKKKKNHYFFYHMLIKVFQLVSNQFPGASGVLRETQVSFLQEIEMNQDYGILFNLQDKLENVLMTMFMNNHPSLPKWLNCLSIYLLMFKNKIYTKNYIQIMVNLVSNLPANSPSFKACIISLNSVKNNPYNSIFLILVMSQQLVRISQTILNSVFMIFQKIDSSARAFLKSLLFRLYFLKENASISRRKKHRLTLEIIKHSSFVSKKGYLKVISTFVRGYNTQQQKLRLKIIESYHCMFDSQNNKGGHEVFLQHLLSNYD